MTVSRVSSRKPDRMLSLSGINGILPQWKCDGCGSLESGPFVLGADKVLLCDECACEIANHYNYAHSGQWLTWENYSENPGKKRTAIKGSKRIRIFERDAYRCRYCGDHHDLCVDHVIPVSQNGGNGEDNLVTACRSCNSRKKNRTPEEANMILNPIPAEE